MCSSACVYKHLLSIYAYRHNNECPYMYNKCPYMYFLLLTARHNPAGIDLARSQHSVEVQYFRLPIQFYLASFSVGITRRAE